LPTGASVAGVYDVLKTAEYNQSSAIQPEQETSQDSFIRFGADDNSPYIQEPDETKVSRPAEGVSAVGWVTTPPTEISPHVFGQ